MRRLGLLAVLVPLLSPAALAGAQAPRVPHARDFSAAVALGARAAGAGPVTSPPRRAPQRFDLLGFRWRAPDHVVIHVRTRRANGRWSPWVEAADAAAHGAPRASDPVWSGAADVYQVRLNHPVTGLRAHFVRVPRIHVPVTARAAAARSGAPRIIPRSAWDPDHDCDPTHKPDYGRVDLAFVHHTVNSNSYSRADSAGIVLAMCRYHERSNGWWDLGYNFVVDRYGQIFEGRAGGVDRPVVGAQAQGYNSVSTGVASIGTFTTVGQTSAGLHALGALIGWKLAVSGDPVRGHITEISGGGPLNAYKAGTHVRLARISGHRDGDATECPGNALYAQLPEIRTLAAAAKESALSTPTLTLATPDTLASYRSAVTFAGRLLLPSGADASGTTITLQRRAGSHWAEAGTATAGSDGSWAVTIHPSTNGRYRARWAGGGDFPAATSPGFSLLVAPRLRLEADDVHVPVGDRAALTGSVAPGKGRVTVWAARRGARGRYTVTDHWTVKPKRGKWTMRVRLRTHTLYRFIARTATDKSNTAGKSPALYVRAVIPTGGAGPG